MLFALVSLLGFAVACPDEHHAHDGHAYARVQTQGDYSQIPLTAPNKFSPSQPYRPLVWGDFNVIHTTDTHGWLLGHHKPSWPEPNYTGDLGDFASFVTHMKQIAIDKDVDLLLVDSGDFHDGNGLSDGYPPGDVDAHESNKFIQRLPYDLMTVGNHELFHYEYVDDMYKNFIPHLNGRYLSSNVNITILGPDGKPTSIPFGDRYVKFKTRKGRRVTSLGVLYNFGRADHNITVQHVESMVKEPWFTEAIAEEPDVFLLVGHMPVSNDHWPDVRQAIRHVHNNTPILIFGGHSHVRDCQQYDDGRLMALESGRYMETIGWMSANLGAAIGNTDNIAFSRRYLDQNRVTYQYHTHTSNDTFDTLYGCSISKGLLELAAKFDLYHFYGTAPHDYTLDLNPYPSEESVLTLFVKEAAPFVFSINNTRANIPNIISVDNGVLRYSVFGGPFTKNDDLVATSYPDKFNYIPNVPAGVATKVLPVMNKPESSLGPSDLELPGRGRDEGDQRTWLEGIGVSTDDLTLGYVTVDGCGYPTDPGDDTLHKNVIIYDLPHYIASNPPNVSDDTPIDLVFLDFIEAAVLKALNDPKVQNTTKYTHDSVSKSPYTPTVANDVLRIYAQAKWN